MHIMCVTFNVPSSDDFPCRSASLCREGLCVAMSCFGGSVQPWNPQCLGNLCFNHGCLNVLVDFVLLSYVSGAFGLEVGAYCAGLEDLGACCAVVFISSLSPCMFLLVAPVCCWCCWT